MTNSNIQTITFMKLKCVKQEDYGSDGDEVRLMLQMNDQQQSRHVIWKGTMKKDQEKEFHETFSTHVIKRVYLIEKDGPAIIDPDDKLGTWIGPFTTTHGNPKQRSFKGDDAHYDLTYSIE